MCRFVEGHIINDILKKINRRNWVKERRGNNLPWLCALNHLGGASMGSLNLRSSCVRFRSCCSASVPSPYEDKPEVPRERLNSSSSRLGLDVSPHFTLRPLYDLEERSLGWGRESPYTAWSCPGKYSHLVTTLISQSGNLPFFSVGFLLGRPGLKEGGSPRKGIDLEWCKQTQNQINCNYEGSIAVVVKEKSSQRCSTYSLEIKVHLNIFSFFSQMMHFEERCPLFYLFIFSTVSI